MPPMRLTLTVLSIAAHLVSQASGEEEEREPEAIKVKWMWGDADFMGIGHATARKDPIRWSGLKSPQETIEQLETQKTMALNQGTTAEREVDVMIVSSPQLDTWVDKKMPTIDAAIAKIGKWTTPESVQAEKERIEREKQLTRYAVQWMWKGASLLPGAVGEKLAEMDPLKIRWSKWKSLKETIDEHEFDYPGQRKVAIQEGRRWDEEKKVYLETQQSEFENMGEAITALGKLGEDAQVQWKWSSGREIMAKKDREEEIRIESYGEHVEKKPFSFSGTWQSCKDTIDEMQAAAQGERDRRNARAVVLRLKKVYGDQSYDDSPVWDEPAAKTGTVPAAIEAMKAYKEEEDGQWADIKTEKTEL